MRHENYSDVKVNCQLIANCLKGGSLMKVTPQQTEKLLKGNQTFKQFGFSMMLTRHKALYAKDPSQITLQNCTAEINDFLTKFQGIMSSDYAIISKL